MIYLALESILFVKKKGREGEERKRGGKKVKGGCESFDSLVHSQNNSSKVGFVQAKSRNQKLSSCLPPGRAGSQLLELSSLLPKVYISRKL